MPSMWVPQQPWWEFVVRGWLVYFLILVLLRLTGRRQVGQLSPFDFVLLLILSNAVQNAMNAGDNSFTAGAVLAVTLVFTNWGLGYVTYYFPRMETLIEGYPRVLIYEGQVRSDTMAREQLTFQEVYGALRQEGCTEIGQVRLCVIESSGRISVIPKKDAR